MHEKSVCDGKLICTWQTEIQSLMLPDGKSNSEGVTYQNPRFAESFGF